MKDEKALAVPESLQQGMVHTGDQSDEGGAGIPAIKLFQGTAQEDELIGDNPNNIKRGNFYDALDHSNFGDAVYIVPVVSFPQWAAWETGSSSPVFSVDNRADIPAGYTPDFGPNGELPTAVKTINVLCVVETIDGDVKPWPYLAQFKRTGIGAFNKTIDPNERRRLTMSTGPGRYKLWGKDDKNPDGQPFKRLSAAVAGDPNGLALSVAEAIVANYEAAMTKAKKTAATESGGADNVDDTPY